MAFDAVCSVASMIALSLSSRAMAGTAAASAAVVAGPLV